VSTAELYKLSDYSRTTSSKASEARRLWAPAQRISKYGITMMTSNACDAGRLQAEQRKRSKCRIILMPSNTSDAS
jgi:hypothetical protein